MTETTPPATAADTPTDDLPNTLYRRVQRRVHEIVETAEGSDRISSIFDVTIMILISLTLVAVILESVKAIGEPWAAWFTGFEIISVIVFSGEYLLRIWACTANPEYRHPILGRLKFALSPMAIIDLLAILPFYLIYVVPIFPSVELRHVRFVRVFRTLRLLKFGRYSESLATMGDVVRSKKEELFITTFVVFVLLVFAASFIYVFEHEKQPEAFSSIPASMWWGVATLTTVGYGDVYPVTPQGRFFAAIVAILGVGVFALPAGILASGFAEVLEERRAKDREGQGIRCPHCRGPIADPGACEPYTPADWPKEPLAAVPAATNHPPAPDTAPEPAPDADGERTTP